MTNMTTFLCIFLLLVVLALSPSLIELYKSIRKYNELKRKSYINADILTRIEKISSELTDNVELTNNISYQVSFLATKLEEIDTRLSLLENKSKKKSRCKK